MRGIDQWDCMLRSLEHVHRRRVLITLLETRPQQGSVIVPEGVHVGERDLDELQAEFVHKHLPKLEQHDFITWNRQTHEVTHGPRFDEIRPLLELLHEHRDELPDGWV